MMHGEETKWFNRKEGGLMRLKEMRWIWWSLYTVVGGAVKLFLHGVLRLAFIGEKDDLSLGYGESGFL